MYIHESKYNVYIPAYELSYEKLIKSLINLDELYKSAPGKRPGCVVTLFQILSLYTLDKYLKHNANPQIVAYLKNLRKIINKRFSSVKKKSCSVKKVQIKCYFLDMMNLFFYQLLHKNYKSDYSELKNELILKLEYLQKYVNVYIANRNMPIDESISEQFKSYMMIVDEDNNNNSYIEKANPKTNNNNVDNVYKRRRITSNLSQCIDEWLKSLNIHTNLDYYNYIAKCMNLPTRLTFEKFGYGFHKVASEKFAASKDEYASILYSKDNILGYKLWYQSLLKTDFWMHNENKKCKKRKKVFIDYDINKLLCI